MWIAYALLSALFASLTAIFAKAGVKNVDPDLATAIRTAVVVVLAWCIVFFKGSWHGLRALTGHNLLFLALSGLATGLSWVFYFRALQAGPVSRVAPLDKLSVAFTILLAFLFLKEPVGIKEIAGATLIVAGGLVLVS